MNRIDRVRTVYQRKIISENLFSMTGTVGRLLRKLLPYIALGFFSAQAVVAEQAHPFAVSLLATVPYEKLWLTLIGCLLGGLLGGVNKASLRYFTIFCVTVMARWVFSEREKKNDNPWRPAVMAALPVATVGFLFRGINELTMEGMLFLLSEVLFSAGGGYFFYRALIYLRKRQLPFQPDLEEFVSLAAVGSIVLLGISQITFGAISPGHLLAVVCILLFARYGGIAAGGVCGTVCGAVLSFGAIGQESAITAGAFGLAGVFSGIFFSAGKFSGTVVFVVTNALCCLMGQLTNRTVIGLFEVALASLLFFLLPERWTEGISAFFADNKEDGQSGGLRHSIAMRLDFSAKTLREISDSVEEISKRLKKSQAEDVSSIYERVAGQVCSKCSHNAYCWINGYERTMNVMNHLTEVLRKYHKIAAENFPSEFFYQCQRMPLLVRAINEEYENFLINQGAEQRLRELRTAVHVQFNGVSDMLEDIAREYEGVRFFERKAEEEITAYLREKGVRQTEVSCWMDHRNQKTVELRGNIAERNTVNSKECLEVIEKICDRKFNTPCTTAAMENYRTVLSQEPILRARVDAVRHICRGNQLCGDSFDWFYDSRGRLVCVISDGMGSGGKAAVDSSMASSLLAQLIKAGMSFDCALKIINSTMMVSSGEETLATLDVTCIDLYSGKAEFLKAGASVGFLRRGQDIYRLEKSSLPVGILREISFATEQKKLQRGDVILMLSDGVLDEENWVSKELLGWKGGASSAKNLCETIMVRAKQHRREEHDDDITVMAIFVA